MLCIWTSRGFSEVAFESLIHEQKFTNAINQVRLERGHYLDESEGDRDKIIWYSHPPGRR